MIDVIQRNGDHISTFCDTASGQLIMIYSECFSMPQTVSKNDIRTWLEYHAIAPGAGINANYWTFRARVIDHINADSFEALEEKLTDWLKEQGVSVTE